MAKEEMQQGTQGFRTNTWPPKQKQGWGRAGGGVAQGMIPVLLQTMLCKVQAKEMERISFVFHMPP